MDQARRKRIRRLVYNTLARIDKMENRVSGKGFWAPILRRFPDARLDQDGTGFKLLIPFSVWVNKQRGELSEEKVFDYIFGETKPQLDLFNNEQTDSSEYITSSEVLEALRSLIKSNGEIPLGIKDLAEEIFQSAPKILQEEVL
jgi:hypothetical protein